MNSRDGAVAALLRDHARTYAEIWGIDLRRPTASPGLAPLVDQTDFPHLIAALVQAELEG